MNSPRCVHSVPVAITALFLLCVPSLSMAQAKPQVTEKLRILVDKVLMAANGWAISKDIVREVSDAGFNVLSPRVGGEDPDVVRRVAAYAAECGIAYMPWMRGSILAKGADRAIWADGTELAIASPNSEEYWQWLTETIIGYARISLDSPALIGVFMDYENYDPKKGDLLYNLSYDKRILELFCSYKGIENVDVPPRSRAAWIQKRGLASEFSDFQVAYWRDRLRALRARIDEINPGFRFCIYPFPTSLFLAEAACRELATPNAPLIVADASTYGRPNAFTGLRGALTANQEKIRNRSGMLAGMNFPHSLIGGIDPSTVGADPEFSARNAAAISSNCDGYWVFYEGPTYASTHKKYFAWFTKVNAAISAGEAAAFWQGK